MYLKQYKNYEVSDLLLVVQKSHFFQRTRIRIEQIRKSNNFRLSTSVQLKNITRITFEKSRKAHKMDFFDVCSDAVQVSGNSNNGTTFVVGKYALKITS